MKRLLFALGIVTIASTASAQSVELYFAEGQVTVYAKEALASDVLLMWQRVGGTQVQGAELLGRRVVSLEMKEVAEGTALADIIGPDTNFAVTEYREPTKGSRLATITILDPRATQELLYAAPELNYKYLEPLKAQPGEISITPEKVTDDVPELLYEYAIPVKTLEPYQESSTFGAIFSWDLPKLEWPYMPPEARYIYYWPLKAR